MQGSLTASQLAQCLYLSPEGTGSANGSEYISTNYYLSINTRKLNLGSRKPTDLLQSVCESYREIFQSNYCDNQSILKEKLEVTTACEPYLRLNELEVRAAALNRYLNARLGENKSFTDEANPDPSTNNFTTLGKMINNLVDYDLPNAMAFVIEGGVARDPAMLTSILEYKNKIDDIDMRTQQAYYDADKKGISIYEKSMTSIMMIPTVDEDSAKNGFAEEFREFQIPVVFPEELQAQIPEHLRGPLLEVLAQDPRAAYNKKPDYIYGMAFDDYDIRFMVAEGILTVKEITRRTQEWKKVK